MSKVRIISVLHSTGSSGKIISVETPGPAASDLSSFSFQSLPPERLDTAISFRHATPAFAQEIASIHTSSWREVYRNILPEDYLNNDIEQERKLFWDKKIQHLPDDESVVSIQLG